MKNLFLVIYVVFTASLFSIAQDTFSIVAIDPETGEVGSAGASCVDLFPTNILNDGFLGDLFPGVGAINTQAAYIQGNQLRARARMNAGDTPTDIIAYMIDNDIQNNPTTRQYGVVAFVDGAPQSAAHTGSNCIDYANHITAPTYSIQGNILLGQEILDSMEARFLREEGDLACKLMAAMQGANVIGADTRCGSNGTSSLFAFLKVAQPDDNFNSPSFKVSVRTRRSAGIEPIDSLQILFDQSKSCADPCGFSYNIGPTVPGFRTKRCLSQITYDGQVRDGEAFVVDNLVAKRKYTFSFCEGYSEDTFEARVIVQEYDSETQTVGGVLSDGVGCTHSIRLTEDAAFDDVIIIVTDNNDCQSTSKNLENGTPQFRCAIGRG